MGAGRYGYFDFLEWKLSKERAFRRGIGFSKYVGPYLCITHLFFSIGEEITSFMVVLMGYFFLQLEE